MHQFYVKQVVQKLAGQDHVLYEVRHRTINEDGVTVDDEEGAPNRFFSKTAAEATARSMTEKANRV